jgi:transcriptional regulator of acetoin/glycerol metabolism
MYQRKLMEKQIETSGLRLGDSCSIYPFQGKKKAFTLNRHCIDLISTKYRPDNLSLSFVELPNTDLNHFHYRLELDDKDKGGRYVLKTIKGKAYWLNGSAAKEAYIERMDRLFIDDNKINFDPFDLKEIFERHFDHPILLNQQLVSSDLKILIQGETGTGKTHLASKIHEKSGRMGKFVSINLSSFNPNLIESELFGHKKGAFTGAVIEKIGAFQEAEGGTLFLDEIDSLPLEVQTKLLTFLDNHRFRRVGEVKEVSIKSRIIFASGRPLESLVGLGTFRKDFYFRLKSGHTIDLSSLRSSPKKVQDACMFYSLKNGVSLSKRLTDFYETLAWPGNLRQLFGHLDKKKVLSKTIKLDFDHLDEELLTQSSDLMNLSDSKELLPLQNVKEDYVKKVLAKCEGNVALASRRLRVTEKTIKSILVKSSWQEHK